MLLPPLQSRSSDNGGQDTRRGSGGTWQVGSHVPSGMTPRGPQPARLGAGRVTLSSQLAHVLSGGHTFFLDHGRGLAHLIGPLP